ncbi:MAG: thiamine-phosphate kinase [Steroidobacteraceae bacterium]
MALGEFELIRRYFSRVGAARDDVLLGVGDDAALVAPPAGQVLAMAVDTLVEGVHFLPDDPADSIGHRALAVNLSDLAAMGAEPAWCLLSLTLARTDEAWLEGFARGMASLARRHRVALIGGDTTSGRLTVAVTVVGFVPAATALRRDGARDGDAIFVSGSVGDAAAGLALRRGSLSAAGADAGALRGRYLRPEPRVALGLALRGVASACIDVSDGLGGDLRKLCEASGVGADLDGGALPVSPELRRAVADRHRAMALGGGDDYELLFTVPPGRCAGVERLASVTPVTRIGRIRGGTGVCCDGVALEGEAGHGFDHFREP